MKINKIILYIFLILSFGCKFPFITDEEYSNIASIGSGLGTGSIDAADQENVFKINNFRAEKINPQSIKLAWDKSVYAYKYAILQSSDGQNFKIIENNLSNSVTTFLVDGLESGVEYSFILQVKNSKNEVLYEIQLKAKTSYWPLNVQARGTNKPSVEISWEWPKTWTKPKSFKIYRKESPHMKDDLLNALTFDEAFLADGGDNYNFFFSDKSEDLIPGKFFYYQVSAICSGKETELSWLVSGYSLDGAAPYGPENLTASQGLYNSKIEIEWDPVLETSDSLAAAKYQLYRRVPGEQHFTLIESNIVGTTSYTDEIGEAKLTQAEYFVIGIAEREEDGALKEVMGQQSKIVTGYVTPSIGTLRATNLAYKNKIEISWEVNVLDYVAGYELYRSDSIDMKNALLCAEVNQAEQKVVVGSEQEFSVVDALATSNKNYFYGVKIITIAVDDNVGAYSNIAKGMAGNLPKPVVAASKGVSDNIVVTCLNSDIDYKNFDVYRKYEYYKPEYAKKEKYAKDLKTDIPENYAEMLKYKINPNRIESEWAKIAKNVSGATFTDNCVINQVLGQTKARGNVEYKIELKNFDDDKSSESESVKGYRKLSNEEFLSEFLVIVDRSQFKMTYIHKGGTDPNTNEDINGDKSGKAEYRPKLGFGKVTVPIYYKNYSDYYLVVDDHPLKAQTTEVSLSADGFLTGGNVISGIYSGSVIFDLVISDGRKSGGKYIVKNGSNPEVNITWDYDRQDAEAYFQTLR